MSETAGTLYNPMNGAPEHIWRGFSWPCLLFGGFWYIYKGIVAWGIIALLLAFITGGISWLIFPFFANAQHTKHLLSKGYLSPDQISELSQRDASTTVSQPVQTNNATTNASAVDEISKLGELREKGLITAEDFEQIKRKILTSL